MTDKPRLTKSGKVDGRTTRTVHWPREQQIALRVPFALRDQLDAQMEATGWDSRASLLRHLIYEYAQGNIELKPCDERETKMRKQFAP